MLLWGAEPKAVRRRRQQRARQPQRSERRKQRYHEDASFRAKTLERAKEYRARKGHGEPRNAKRICVTCGRAIAKTAMWRHIAMHERFPGLTREEAKMANWRARYRSEPEFRAKAAKAVREWRARKRGTQ